MSGTRLSARVIEFKSPEKTATKAEIPELVSGSVDALLQGLELLSGLSDEAYAKMMEPPYKASIGQHYRHILEHFQCLTRGTLSGEVNYDARERNLRVESERPFALAMTREVLQAIENYGEQMLELSTRVIHSLSRETTTPTSIESNVGRELAYCTGHAIHHYAIIRLICAQQGVEVPAEFGYAPSTLKHMSTLNAD